VSEPILLVVDDDDRARGALARALERRFGADYRVLSDRSPASALGRLRQAREASEEVALLVAGQWMAEMTGIDWLARARELCPRATRVLVLTYGDVTAIPLVRRAMALGQVESLLMKPWLNPEERLYPLVSEALGAWVRMARPHVEILRIVGERWAARCHELRDLSERNGIPYGFYPHDSEEGRRLLQEVGHTGPLPVVIFHDGRLLVDPTEVEIAHILGARTEAAAELYDLLIIGAGPAGLAAAVYGASEGLRTLVVERQALGGQAGTSSMIRNYLGFPRGVGGTELATRAYEQAWSFGAEFVFTREAAGLVAKEAERIVTLAGGSEIRARTVVIATGVAYNRLDVDGAEALLGKGIFYGAATTEARALAGHHVFIVGAGNSAGQAALHLARYAATVTMLVRGDSLAASMSDYLVRQIGRTRNIRVRPSTRVLGARGTHHLEALDLADTAAGTTDTVEAAALFVLIGAGPHTGWLAGTLQRIEPGYVLTGRSVVPGGQPAWPVARAPLLLETSMPGVFAAGDVRHRAVKRVASAVGEGAIVIHSVHEYLAEE
jgi:thioredoxin reductase (NADPH)